VLEEVGAGFVGEAVGQEGLTKSILLDDHECRT
jgi:hypothetical protein